jgi:pimeloyl-ACP methyl ester carboxylesterase
MDGAQSAVAARRALVRSKPDKRCPSRSVATRWSYMLPLQRVALLAVVLLILALLTASPAGSQPAANIAAKNIVLVHGAFVDGSGWRPVYDILKKRGYNVSIVQLPLTSVSDDVAATKAVLARQNGSTVLVGHSYGGSVISASGDDQKVTALVYVAAFQPDTGEAIGALTSKFAPPSDAVRPIGQGFLELDRLQYANVFAADLPRGEAEFMAASQKPIAASAFAAQSAGAAWRTKPTYAILASQDRALSPDLQRWMYKRSGSKVTEVKASHAVYASQPEVVARVIETAARAEP